MTLPLTMTNVDYMAWTYRIKSGRLWSWIESRLENKQLSNVRIGFFNNYNDDRSLKCDASNLKVYILGWTL